MTANQHGPSRFHHLPDGRIYPEPFVDELPFPRVVHPAEGEVAVIGMLTSARSFHRALPTGKAPSVSLGTARAEVHATYDNGIASLPH